MIKAILLAAGQSKRLKDENKLIKEINGLPLIKHAVKNILGSAIDELIIVLGHEKEVIKKFIDRDKKINTIVFLSTVECYGVSENTKNVWYKLSRVFCVYPKSMLYLWR